MSSVQPGTRPWFREPWPWLLMVPPAAAVLGGLATLYLAGGVPAMVVEDYGRIGEISEQRRVLDERAATLGAVARVFVDPPGDSRVAIDLELAGAEPPVRIRLALRHPQSAGRDAVAWLGRVDGRYEGRIARPGGRLHLELDGDDWRLAGILRDGATGVRLEAAAVAAQEPAPPAADAADRAGAGR